MGAVGGMAGQGLGAGGPGGQPPAAGGKGQMGQQPAAGGKGQAPQGGQQPAAGGKGQPGGQQGNLPAYAQSYYQNIMSRPQVSLPQGMGGQQGGMPPQPPLGQTPPGMWQIGDPAPPPQQPGMGGQPAPGGQGSRWPGGDQQMEDFNTRLRASEASVRQQMGLPMYGGEDNPRFQAAMREQQNSIMQQMGLPQPGMGGQQAPQVMPQRMNEMSPAERAYMERDARDQADRARVGEERYRAYQQMTPEQREQREQEYRQRQMADLPPNLQALLNNTRSIPQVMPQQGMGGQQPGMGGQQALSIAQQLSGMGGMSAIMQNPQLLQSPQFQGLFGGQQAPQPPQMSVQDFNQQRQNLVAQRDQALRQGRNANDIVRQMNDLTRNFSAQRNSSVQRGPQPTNPLAQPQQLRPEDPRMMAMRNLQQLFSAKSGPLAPNQTRFDPSQMSPQKLQSMAQQRSMFEAMTPEQRAELQR